MKGVINILKIDQYVLNYLDAEKQLINLIYKSGTTDKKTLYAIIKRQEKMLFEIRQEYDIFGETGEIRLIEIDNAEKKIDKWKEIMKDKVGWMPKDKKIINDVNENKETKQNER